jgi:hypothetical protein
MKKILLLKTVTLLIFSAVMAGCSSLPIDLGVKEGHFRLENFAQNNRPTKEYVYLMCRLHRPVDLDGVRQHPAGVDVPRQHPAGQHNLWVKVVVNKPSVAPTEFAFVNFDVSLDEGKSYMLNLEREGQNASVWIQEVETGIVASEIKTQELEVEQFVGNLRWQQCEEGTV